MEAALHWWRRSDHYPWLTALLTARSVQTHAWRLMALVTVGFGVVPLAVIASPTGPHGRTGIMLAGLVTVVSLAQTGMWLRGRWPSKRRSITYVVLCSLCIAVACLIQTQPIAGLLGCTAFAALAGYTAFFHSARLMTVNAVVACATTVTLAIRLALAGDPVLAVCAALAVWMTYILVPFAALILMRLLDVDEPNSDIDPLTGLVNRRSFYRRTAELFSVRGRLDDRYLTIVLIELDNFMLLNETKGPGAGERACVAVAQTLRETTRGDAVVARSGAAEFLISDTFATADATPLVERVRGAIATTPPRLTASIGVVCTPLRALAELPPEDTLDALIALAQVEMTTARRAGGNQARYIETAAPRLDERGIRPDDEPW